MSGFGSVKLQRYGEVFLKETKKYATENNLSFKMPEKIPRRAPPPSAPANTHFESLNLYKAGHNISEIAKQRGLVETTIESHLATFVRNGELPVENFISPDKLEQLLPIIRQLRPGPIGPVKQHVGDAASYSDIRFAISHWERLETI
jgi:ATP-dependent DNA helicase RecQ